MENMLEATRIDKANHASLLAKKMIRFASHYYFEKIDVADQEIFATRIKGENIDLIIHTEELSKKWVKPAIRGFARLQKEGFIPSFSLFII